MARLALSLLLSTFYFLFSTLAPALATTYQQCQTSSTCTIGEFLYNDDYTILTGQSCTLTAKYPDGTSFVTSAAMTGRSDGWYSYDASISTTTGLYAATICCTPASGLMCLDKSFEVKTPVVSGATPEDIWGYSNRTLTSYGTLVNDIWSASTRSLTSFGSLVGDVWGYSGRTLTSFGSLVENIWGAEPQTSTVAVSGSPTSLEGIVAEQKAQRELLEKLVNTPIISLSLEEGSAIPDLESKLEESHKQASIFYDAISSAKSRLMTLDAKWSKLSQDARVTEISNIASTFHNPESLASLSKSWDHETLSELSKNTTSFKSDLALLLTSTSNTSSSTAPSALTDSLVTLSTLEDLLGDTTNTSSDKTLFGYLSSVSDRSTTLKSENQKISALLESLNGQGVTTSQKAVGSIKSRLLTLNEFPGGESIVSPAIMSQDPLLNLRNILFSLQGLVGLNQMQLAMNVGDPVRGLWLEEGSIVFRAVITNPSPVISQTVPLKFYLPREVKTQDIITLDPTLSTTYDSVEEALYAAGSFDLKPKETKVVYVEIEDIWILTSEELESLRTKARDLLKPLEDTAYFSQGTTLKSDIDATLSQVMLTTSRAVTPENKIRTYREAKLELTKVATNMNRLEDLVAQSSGTGSLFGFVGGVQTVAVWGIILVVIAGFVFLSIYFKKLGITPSDTSISQDPVNAPLISPALPTLRLSPLSLEDKVDHRGWYKPATIILVIIVTAGSTIALTQLTKRQPTSINQVVSSPSPTPSPTTLATPTPEPIIPSEVIIKEEKSVLGDTSDSSTTSTLTVPEDSSVNLRNQPSTDGDIIMAIKSNVEVYVFKQSGDWSQIGFKESDLAKGYWVSSEFLTSQAN